MGWLGVEVSTFSGYEKCAGFAGARRLVRASPTNSHPPIVVVDYAFRMQSSNWLPTAALSASGQWPSALEAAHSNACSTAFPATAYLAPAEAGQRTTAH